MIHNRKFFGVIWPTLIIFLILMSIYPPSITVRAASSDYVFSAKWPNPDPYFIDVDESGNVYVAGRNSNQVQKYDSNGNLLATWGGPGSGNGQFNDPEGIAVDNERGLIYVTDCNNNRIQRFDLNGKFLGIAGSMGSGAGQFINPAGIAVDSYGNVYVADRENDRIQKFYPNGTFIRMWGRGGDGPGEFNSPESVAADRLGFVYVGDEENNRVQKFDSNGFFLAVLGTYGNGDGQFIDPEDVAIDNLGNVYVADSDNSRIQKFNSNGTFVGKLGSQGKGDGQFNDPRGVAVDLSGNVYMADTGNGRIQKFTSNTGTMVLQVTDLSQTPINGATVYSVSLPSGQSDNLKGTTGTDGYVSFNDVTQGTYLMHASKNEYTTAAFTVTVTPSSTITDEITLVVANRHDLRVTLIDENRNPVNGATVSITGPDVLQSASLTTNNLGEVIFHDLLDGPNLVQASMTGYDPRSSEVTVGVVNYIVLVLQRGTYSSMPLRITVIAQDRTPVVGATVSITGPDVLQSVSLTTNNLGEVIFSGLPNGLILVQASKTGYDPCSAEVTVGAVNYVILALFRNTPVLTRFEFDTIPSPQTVGTDFNVKVYAIDQLGSILTSYNGENMLGNNRFAGGDRITFSEGRWSGPVRINGPATEIALRTFPVASSSITGLSNTFIVNESSTSIYLYGIVGIVTLLGVTGLWLIMRTRLNRVPSMSTANSLNSCALFCCHQVVDCLNLG